jgi:hypothetical protein
MYALAVTGEDMYPLSPQNAAIMCYSEKGHSLHTPPLPPNKKKNKLTSWIVSNPVLCYGGPRFKSIVVTGYLDSDFPWFYSVPTDKWWDIVSNF